MVSKMHKTRADPGCQQLAKSCNVLRTQQKFQNHLLNIQTNASMVEQLYMHINPKYKITFPQDENSLNNDNSDERSITDMPTGNKQLTYP